MGKGRGKGRGRTAGAKDRLPRKRRNATSDELANKAAKKALKRQKGQADSEAAKQRFVSSIPSAPSGGAADGRAATSRGDLGSENTDVSEMQGARVVSRGENGPRSHWPRSFTVHAGVQCEASAFAHAHTRARMLALACAHARETLYYVCKARHHEVHPLACPARRSRARLGGLCGAQT